MVRLGIDIKHEGRTNAVTAKDFIDCAQRAEAAGFESVWTNEDIGYDSLAVLSAAAQHTSRVKLGTAVVNVYARSAMQLAMGATTLDELSDGRAILGLSVGHHPWNDLGHGIPIEAPLPRVREYVRFIRKAASGEPFTHDGRIFRGVSTRLNFEPVRPALPIYVAGERPGMIKTAAEVADGLLINVVPAEYIATFVTDHVRASARAVGRDPDQFDLTAVVTCCVGDRETALAQARETFRYRLVRNVARMLQTQPAERHDEIRALRDLVEAGQAERAAAQASPELVTSIVNAGTAEDVWRRLRQYFDAGCTRVVVAAYPRTRADVEGLIDALSPYMD